jgi:hypothetical protein
MRIASLIIFLVFLIFFKKETDSPHGPGFKESCIQCHSSEGWEFNKAIYSFDHSKTRMALTGQHSDVDCRKCHLTLVFNEAKSECNNCHADLHQATTGLDCERCHTPVSWLVSNITELHQRSRFPLLGAHRIADCTDCHKSETAVRFDVPGVECVDCHRAEYLATTNPNHAEAGFSEDCSSCHPVNSVEWKGSGFNHGFFPLVQGHDGLICSACHKTSSYADVSPDCVSCHQTDFDASSNPNHASLNFPVTCALCHTLAPGWKPASYKDHDSKSFPIYSGRHNGTWNTCAECHANPTNYAQFTCLTCHEHNKTSMDNAHREEGDYSYESTQCLRCHPRGNSD